LDKIKNGANGLGNLANTYSQIVAAVDRVYREVLDIKSDLPESRQNKVIESPQGRIEFHEVTFRYPDGTLALENVSFVIEPGESLALVGRSGAGKSTITDLILRFYDPTEGKITFDGIDLRDLDVNWLRQRIGVVPQQTMLFAASLKENLGYGNPHASDDEIKAAAMMAHADEFIDKLPEKYDTKLGERGTRLSGGEMQRVAIARALLIDPTLLILDEATSSLDPLSERKVQEALSDAMQERTTLLIAHRLNTAARADKIVVLNRGQTVEVGSHDELLERNGTYAGMYRAFSTGVFDGEL
jgi:subfamily B ATP-binding cassette protein MsbA